MQEAAAYICNRWSLLFDFAFVRGYELRYVWPVRIFTLNAVITRYWAKRNSVLSNADAHKLAGLDSFVQIIGTHSASEYYSTIIPLCVSAQFRPLIAANTLLFSLHCDRRHINCPRSSESIIKRGAPSLFDSNFWFRKMLHSAKRRMNECIDRFRFGVEDYDPIENSKSESRFCGGIYNWQSGISCEETNRRTMVALPTCRPWQSFKYDISVNVYKCISTASRFDCNAHTVNW